jgi:hypothetical protein
LDQVGRDQISELEALYAVHVAALAESLSKQGADLGDVVLVVKASKQYIGHNWNENNGVLGLSLLLSVRGG